MDVSTFMFKVLAAGFRDEAGETALSAGCQVAVSGRAAVTLAWTSSVLVLKSTAGL